MKNNLSKEEIKDLVIKASAKKDFYAFCRVTKPQIYTKKRPHLKFLCDEIQNFIEDKETQFCILTVPPRHGKSITASCLTQWIFGQDVTKRVMTGSYNETLSTTFSKTVRNGIQEKKARDDIYIYSDIFPDTKIKAGDGAMNLWSLEGGNNNYLATSPQGTATGFGADLLIIDDVIKSAKEANNAILLEQHWTWFTDTMLSRVEKNWKVLIVMTRWASKDLAGRIIQHCEENQFTYKEIKMKALQDDGTMLCEDMLSKADYEIKKATMSAEIFEANYQQTPINLKGVLYKKFKTYDKIPIDIYGRAKFDSIECYVDTADTGSDYLCSIIYGIINNEAYVLDVYYTKEHMEVTEKEVAKRLTEFKVNTAHIESNNGGRGFARSVERELIELNNNLTVILTFHQSTNKNARILSMATWVMEHIYYPTNWDIKWREFYISMKEYQREGQNEHDDAQDTITGVAEKLTEGGTINFG